jgi:NTP pyrophosphohydrolases including oxidative damage repair enzymes
MEKIKKITKLTNTPYVNLYELDARNTKGKPFSYFLASRIKQVENLKINTKKNKADGVLIYSVYGENKDKLVLVKQYRYTIDDYIYEFPAGLVEEREDFKQAGIRELKEETGLDLQVVNCHEMYQRPQFTTIGMTDESCGTIYGYASGNPTIKGLEASEELEVVLVDRTEAARILKEEKIAIMCAYMLMHFINTTGDPLAFLKDSEDEHDYRNK